MAVQTTVFGEHEGRAVHAFRLERQTRLGPMAATLIEYGATLVGFEMADRNGASADIVLGHDSLDGYLTTPTYFGAIAGRYGNRLRGARIVLDGRVHDLVPNEGANQLHGGPRGFDKVLWTGQAGEDGHSVRFTYASPDGEGGFPGRLDLAVTFAIEDSGTFNIDMVATADRATVCNPVHHTYWNLAGHTSGDVLSHIAAFEADFYTPVDGELLATGEIRAVAGTPFDFRTPKAIGADIAALEEDGGGRAAYEGGGYDHNFVLRDEAGRLKRCVRVTDPASGRGMELWTTEPGVQFYTGGYLNPSIVGKGGHPYARYGGFTLETQKFPGSPEFGHFPSARLDPGETYRHRMEFRFFHDGSE